MIEYQHRCASQKDTPQNYVCFWAQPMGEKKFLVRSCKKQVEVFIGRSACCGPWPHGTNGPQNKAHQNRNGSVFVGLQDFFQQFWKKDQAKGRSQGEENKHAQ